MPESRLALVTFFGGCVKRSEMIDILCQPIKVNPKIDLHLLPAEANAILNKLEEAGMQPPTIEEKRYRIEGDAGIIDMVNEWEAEDEEIDEINNSRE